MTAAATSISFRSIVAIWLIAATIAVLQSATQFVHLRGDPRNWGLVALTFLGWMVWAVLTPPIIGLTRRFPLQRRSVVKAIAVHFFAAVVCVSVVGILWQFLSRAFIDVTGILPTGYWRNVLNPVGHAMVGVVTYGCIVAAVTAFDALKRSHRAALTTARL